MTFRLLSKWAFNDPLKHLNTLPCCCTTSNESLEASTCFTPMYCQNFSQNKRASYSLDKICWCSRWLCHSYNTLASQATFVGVSQTKNECIHRIVDLLVGLAVWSFLHCMSWSCAALGDLALASI